jgi:hypothetical protein
LRDQLAELDELLLARGAFAPGEPDYATRLRIGKAVIRDPLKFPDFIHTQTMQGIENWTNAEAVEKIAHDRETHQRDLYESIERGDFPKWKFSIQAMPESDVGKHWYNPFDLTKVWPHKDYPLIEVGIFELNRNPQNYFAEVEQAARTPANVVPGVGHSPDKMLQARIFSYADAHRYRVGVNAEQLPVNKPRCPVHHYHADGAMRLAGHSNPDAYYEPNSFGGAMEDPVVKEPPLKLSSNADRYNHRNGNDDYRQAGELFRLMSVDQKDQLFNNIKAAMDGVPADIVKRRAFLPRRPGLWHRRCYPHGPLRKRPARGAGGGVRGSGKVEPGPVAHPRRRPRCPEQGRKTAARLFVWAATARDEHVAAREFAEQVRWLRKIRGEHVGGIARNPLRQVDRLVYSRVEPDQDAGRLVADILDRVPVALRDIPDIAFL